MQIDVNDLGALIVAQMRTDHVNVPRLSAGGEAADMLQKFEHGFLTAIGNAALPTDDFAEQEDVLATKFADGDLYACPGLVGDELGDFGGGFAFDAHFAVIAQIDAAIGTDLVFAVELGALREGQVNDVGTADAIVLEHAFV